MRSRVPAFIKSIVNSYAMLFFSQNSVLGIILLLVSFLNPLAGFSGVFCVLLALIVVNLSGFQRECIQAGIFSFNSLLLGLAFGTFYQFNLHYVVWLVFTTLLLIMITIILAERLGRSGMPILSLPFILCFWVLLFSLSNTLNVGLIPKSNLVVQEVYGGTANLYGLHNYLSAKIPYLLALFFRSLSAILFQDNIITGAFIALGLLVHSRIAFSLIVIGFLVANGFNAMFNIYPGGISYYHLGANFMMATVAIGSFFAIPSVRSYLWAIACVPVMFLLINAFTGVLAVYDLPVFSLPFCLICFIVFYFLYLRKKVGGLQLAALQHYSPERNLYQFINQQTRLDNLKYFRFNLPFMGSWTVSQGYDGNITHKNEWGQALDFVVKDEDKKTYTLPGTLPEHFYSFNKPVLACADGFVVNVINHIEDNAIGHENLQQNWGNTIVIKHLDCLYSKVSHLKKQSIKVKAGDVVKQGELIGLCGNSGRSPEPHLHFQLQATPYIDAKTIEYPFAYYLNKNDTKESLSSFNVPKEGDVVKPVIIDSAVKAAFDFQPGYTATLSSSKAEEHVEVFGDEINQTFFYSKTNGAAAYFINDGTRFYFTSFYGDQKSLLYLFYLAAYKITFSSNEGVYVQDVFPLYLLNNKSQLWLQDFVAPFIQFIRLNYHSVNLPQKNGVIVQSTQLKEIFGKQITLTQATVSVLNNNIREFNIYLNGNDNKVKWVK